jgi:hypothetical protein
VLALVSGESVGRLHSGSNCSFGVLACLTLVGPSASAVRAKSKQGCPVCHTKGEGRRT